MQAPRGARSMGAAWALTVVVAVLMTALPAAAHTGPGGEDATSTNYRTRITKVTPAVDGLTVKVIDTGSRLELRNETGSEVVVLGYAGEPYLRINSDGVFENTNSPATYLNRDRQGQTNPPAGVDADDAPSWSRVDGGDVARWHDHRAHWMGALDPPQVEADPRRSHVVYADQIVPVRVDGETVEITVDVTWVPGPAAWPWFVAMAVVAIALATLGRFRWWPKAVTVALGILSVAVVADVLGDRLAAGGAGAGGLLVPVMTVLLAGAAAAVLRRSTDVGGLMAAALGLICIVVFSAGKFSWLSRSQLPTGLDPLVARAVVSCLASVGAGIVGLVTVRVLVMPPQRRSDSAA